MSCRGFDCVFFITWPHLQNPCVVSCCTVLCVSMGLRPLFHTSACTSPTLLGKTPTLLILPKSTKKNVNAKRSTQIEEHKKAKAKCLLLGGGGRAKECSLVKTTKRHGMVCQWWMWAYLHFVIRWAAPDGQQGSCVSHAPWKLRCHAFFWVLSSLRELRCWRDHHWGCSEWVDACGSGSLCATRGWDVCAPHKQKFFLLEYFWESHLHDHQNVKKEC